MTNDPDQPALFDLPQPLRRAPKLATPRSGRPTYTKFRPARHTLCDDCIRDIHARGAQVAPYPSGVRWRRTHAGVIDLLCQRHKDGRVHTDG